MNDIGPCENCGATHVPRIIVRHGGERHIYCENIPACNRRAVKAAAKRRAEKGG